MTERKATTKMLSELTEQLINPNNDLRIYWAREVTFDYATTHAVRVDFMQFKPVNNTVSGIEKGDFYCYEVKSSVEDFHSKNGHNFLGDYNYYVMPKEVYEVVSQEIPYAVGVYCPDGAKLCSVRKAKRRDREHPVSEMLLMMFRSATRDSGKSNHRFVDLEQTMDESTLYDWYISSVSQEDEPVWTERHITELLNDFHLIPKK